MITREKYLNCLAVVEQYHEQIKEESRLARLKSRTLVTEFILENDCSKRLENVLLDSGIEFIEQVYLKDFYRLRNAGSKTWDELQSVLKQSKRAR